ncbi:hypothetical protein LUZ60_012925 [Juncus effusus]|nr:hypothetical protein LUZ60_012925 [Juncus effusus]
MDDKLTTQETLIANFLILLVQTLNYNDKSLSESLIDYNLMMRVSFQKDQVNWGNWKEKRFDKFYVVVISSFSLKNKFWRNLKWQKGEIPVKYQLEISSQFSISEEICDSQIRRAQKKMSSSTTVVHPMGLEAGEVNAGPGAPQRHLPRMSGTLLRFLQFFFAAPAIYIMASAPHFHAIPAFLFLVAVLVLQTVWIVWLIVVELHPVLYHNFLQNPRILGLFTIVDGIMLALTFAAACASTGTTVFIGSDLSSCPYSHCPNFGIATILTFLTLFAASPIFVVNFSTLVGLDYLFA